MAVGMFNSTISLLYKNLPSFEMLFKYLTMALNEFPWATIITFLPDLIVGTIVSFQNGKTLSIVSFKLFWLIKRYLSFWEQCWINVLVFSIEFWMSLVVFVQFWWRDIEWSSPNLDLFFSVLLDGFDLVESLQGTVVSFVQSPRLNDWNVVAIKLVSGIIECLDSSGQDRCVGNIELESVLLQGFTGFDGLLDTFGCKTEILPFAESLTSVHPVNLFSLFQLLSPCLKKTTLYFLFSKNVRQHWTRTC